MIDDNFLIIDNTLFSYSYSGALHATRLVALGAQADSVLERRNRSAQLKSMTADISHAGAGAADAAGGGDPLRLAHTLRDVFGGGRAEDVHLDVKSVAGALLAVVDCSAGRLAERPTEEGEPQFVTRPDLENLVDWLTEI